MAMNAWNHSASLQGGNPMTEQASSIMFNRPISTRARLLAGPAALAIASTGPFIRRSSAQNQTTVRVTGWTSSGAEFDLFSQVLKDFEAAHPEIKISYEPVPSDYPTKLQTDIAAGTVADVFYVDSMLSPDLMAAGQLLPLDDFMAQSGVKAEDFYPGLIKAFQWEGKTYGLPKDWSPLGTVYDTKALTDAGVSAAPATWDELSVAGKALLDTLGEPRIMIPPDFARYLAFHYAAGAEIISADGTQIVINSPEAQQALEFYYGMYRDGIATTPADAGAQWPGDGLAKDLADLVFEGNWIFPFLKDSAPDLQYGIAEMPAGPAGKATLGFTVSFSAFVGTKVPEAAWTVINYLTGPEGMLKWTSLGLAMPSRPGLAEEWLKQYPEREPYLKSGEYARAWQLGVGGQAFYNDATAELQALFAGSQDVATTLQRMEEAAKRRIRLQATPVATPAA
jgi:multiple sugar transport system substrate-binding protein